MTLFEEPHFTFRFAADRIIPRFHLEGVEAGRRIAVFKIDPVTGERLGQIASAVAGEGGWVDLSEPIVVRAGEGFVAVTADESVRLRPVQLGDLPRICDMQLDSDSNRMAVTIPRTAEAFHSHWAKVLDDPAYAARAILLDEALVGTVTRFPKDRQNHIGYWIERAHWGTGIASRALDLMLREVTERPLFATAATTNGASLRVLQKCGFVVEQVYLSPACERFAECEKAVLVLR